MAEQAPVLRKAARRQRRLRMALTFIAGALLLNALVGERGFVETWRAARETRALAASIAGLRAENSRLRDEARRLREDPAAIETLARRDLGLIHPGEILVVVKDKR
jgi:cell division protein FtsB